MNIPRDCKLAVVGGRNFSDYDYMKSILDSFRKKFGISIIVSGGARGADSYAERYASEHEIDLHVFEAKWSQDGKAAGPRRNLRIAEYADVMLAFPDTESRGTYNAINLMKKLGKPVKVFKNE